MGNVRHVWDPRATVCIHLRALYEPCQECDSDVAVAREKRRFRLSLPWWNFRRWLA